MSDDSSCRCADLAPRLAYLEATVEGVEQRLEHRIEVLESENRRLREALRNR